MQAGGPPPPEPERPPARRRRPEPEPADVDELPGFDDDVDAEEPEPVDSPPPARGGSRRRQAPARKPVVRRADPSATVPPRRGEQTSEWRMDDPEHYDEGYADDDEDYADYADYADYPRYPIDEDERPRKRRKVLFGIGSLLVVVLVGVGVWLGMREFLGIGYSDYDGPGQGDVLVRVQTGDSTAAIGDRLAEMDVVASANAFTSAGENSDALRSVQPGYYVMRKKMSAKAAVDMIVAPESRVGEMQVEPGTRLDDVKQPNGKVVPGVYSKLSKASCAELNGKSTCVSVDELRKAVADTDPAELGVPDWAAKELSDVEPVRRLEGLVAPDVYQVRPGDDAKTLLKTVLTGSVARMQASGLPSIAGDTGYSPYKILVMASLVQSEAVQNDFGKVSRVTYNRLKKDQKLQYDSTVNYVLDRPEIRTRATDRNRAGPYNTYGRKGLPPTPISAPSGEAIEAAVKPEPGNWLYFVKCEKNGLSCFAVTSAEHERNIKDAQARGVY